MWRQTCPDLHPHWTLAVVAAVVGVAGVVGGGAAVPPGTWSQSEVRHR